jgi:hypothetical protein
MTNNRPISVSSNQAAKLQYSRTVYSIVITFACLVICTVGVLITVFNPISNLHKWLAIPWLIAQIYVTIYVCLRLRINIEKCMRLKDYIEEFETEQLYGIRRIKGPRIGNNKHKKY